MIDGFKFRVIHNPYAKVEITPLFALIYKYTAYVDLNQSSNRFVGAHRRNLQIPAPFHIPPIVINLI